MMSNEYLDKVTGMFGGNKDQADRPGVLGTMQAGVRGNLTGMGYGLGGLAAGAVLATPFGLRAARKLYPEGVTSLAGVPMEQKTGAALALAKRVLPAAFVGGTVGGMYGIGQGTIKSLQNQGYMNKEAALANLLEQGYTVEHAVGLLKQADRIEPHLGDLPPEIQGSVNSTSARRNLTQEALDIAKKVAGSHAAQGLAQDLAVHPDVIQAVQSATQKLGEKGTGLLDTAQDYLNKARRLTGGATEPAVAHAAQVTEPVVADTAQTAARKLPTWAKAGLVGLGTLGAGYGAYKGYGAYQSHNKEAALSNLLEQGYSLEHAVGLLKKAEAASYEDLLRAQSANEKAQYRGSAEGVLGAGITGAAGAGLGYMLGKTPTQKAKFVGIGTSLGAIPGSVLGYLHGSRASRENSLNQMNKEAALSNLLEQGYSLEHALAALRHTG